MNVDDLRDILTLPSKTTSNQPLSRFKGSTTNKPPGKTINRELLQLTGGAPSFATNVIEPSSTVHFKEKPKFTTNRTKWYLLVDLLKKEKRIFKNFQCPSRSDGLTFQHWERDVPHQPEMGEGLQEQQQEQQPEPSWDRFHRFNKDIDLIEYSDQEYQEVLLSSPSSSCCCDVEGNANYAGFDLRFLVIADRYEFPGSPNQRTLEDLKDRYYEVVRKLLIARGQNVPPEMVFNKHREEERKKSLVALVSRSATEIAEEESLFMELRRLVQQQKRWQKDHEQLMRLMESRECVTSGTSILTGSFPTSGQQNGNGSPSNTTILHLNTATPTTGGGSSNGNLNAFLTNSKKRLKRKESSSGGGGGGGGGGLTGGSGTMEKVSSTSGGGGGGGGSTTSSLVRKERLPVGVNIRSNTIRPLRGQQMLQKVTQTLRELGIGYRPVMATQTVCTAYERLQQSALLLHEYKKNADRIEHEWRVLMARKAELMNRLGEVKTSPSLLNNPGSTTTTATSNNTTSTITTTSTSTEGVFKKARK